MFCANIRLPFGFFLSHFSVLRTSEQTAVYNTVGIYVICVYRTKRIRIDIREQIVNKNKIKAEDQRWYVLCAAASLTFIISSIIAIVVIIVVVVRNGC